MIGWRFLLSRRWAGYLAIALIFASVCVSLGFWQLARRAEALTEIDRVASNFDADPTPLAEALPELDTWDDSQKWLTVSMTGTYLVDDQLLVRNRPLNGNPGFEVLTPLQLSNGDVFVVDRGWLPTGQDQDAPDAVPAPPSGTVTVVVRLKAGEPHLDSRGATPGQIATIELPLIEQQVGEPTYTGAYGLLASEDPAPATRPVAVEKPVPDEGPHLSYAFQWFVFALLGFVALGYIARQEYRQLNSDDPDEQERAAERARKRASRRSDADIEDDILDGRG
ncbi:sortase [Cnuibacter physcomitrellae]|uniref:SURF1-like protein n=1 Tax=Cnuibacter physcomitrellae TaxID=1619308 RepID=A0A1X9LQD7_9MICO|nr:SURF1 family protein [Cnuibacter physcomitrellae]ARJ05339.1 sortase [Cnuibacter physcomitrellae]